MKEYSIWKANCYKYAYGAFIHTRNDAIDYLSAEALELTTIIAEELEDQL